MEDKYFLNRNNKKSYSFDELIDSEIIFHDDLIWKKGLTDWTEANLVDELKDHVIERPPEKKSIIILKKIISSIFPSLIILVLFSTILGLSGGLLEKYEYSAFIKKIQPNIDAQIKRQNDQAESRRKIENEKDLQSTLLNQRIKTLYNKYNKRDKVLESFQNEAYSKYKNATNPNDMNFFMSLANKYLDERDSLLKAYESDKLLLESSVPSDPFDLKSSSSPLITYDIPMNTIYAKDGNGKSFTRWAFYNGVGNHEQLSYENTHTFLFRPYRAFFSVVNLSDVERENILVLLWNFILSALSTNFLFFPLLVFSVVKLKKT